MIPTDLWRWPLRSPRHLLVTVAIVTALLTGLCLAVSSGRGRPHAGPASGAARPSASASHRAPPASPTRDLSQALDTARRFVTAWAHHPADWREWYGSTARYATDQYAQLLATVDPRTISATRVLGRLRLTDTGTAHTEVAVRTDAGMVSVVLVPATGNSGGWQVQDLRPGAQAVD